MTIYVEAALTGSLQWHFSLTIYGRNLMNFI